MIAGYSGVAVRNLPSRRWPERGLRGQQGSRSRIRLRGASPSEVCGISRVRCPESAFAAQARAKFAGSARFAVSVPPFPARRLLPAASGGHLKVAAAERWRSDSERKQRRTSLGQRATEAARRQRRRPPRHTSLGQRATTVAERVREPSPPREPRSPTAQPGSMKVPDRGPGRATRPQPQENTPGDRSGVHVTYRCYLHGPDGVCALSPCGPGAHGT